MAELHSLLTGRSLVESSLQPRPVSHSRTVAFGVGKQMQTASFGERCRSSYQQSSGPRFPTGYVLYRLSPDLRQPSRHATHLHDIEHRVIGRARQ
jgi:hypothetical protein